MKENKEVKNMWKSFNCILCGKKITLFCVGEPNYQCPCVDCQLAELDKDI